MKLHNKLAIEFRENTPSEKYAEFLARIDMVDIFQDIKWVEVSKAKNWTNNNIFSLEADGEIVVAAIGYSNYSKFFGNYLYIQHGPIFSTPTANLSNWGDPLLDEQMQAHLAAFLQGLKKFASKNNFFAVILEPLATEDSIFGKMLFAEKYQMQDKSILPKFPMFIDIESKDEVELTNDLPKKTRYNINYATRQEITIEYYYPETDADFEKNESAVAAFYQLLIEASGNKGYDIPPQKFFAKAWEEYRGSRNICFVLAKYQGKVISANFTQFYKNWAGSYYTANSREFSKLRASYLLKWATILEAKRNGCKLFDMWGYIPNLKPGDAEFGYGQFKQSFEPAHKTFAGRMILPISPFKFKLWKLIGELRYKFSH